MSCRKIRRVLLPGISLIYSAELHAVRLALDIILSQHHSKYLIYSVSLSAILALQNPTNKNPVVQKAAKNYPSSGDRRPMHQFAVGAGSQ